MMEFDYTQAKTEDTLQGGAIQGYRIMHWLADILKNWFSDPINIKDDRLIRLLYKQDGDADTELRAQFDIGTPYNPEVKKACSTPMILVSLGNTQYPGNHFNNYVEEQIAQCGAVPMTTGIRYRRIELMIHTYTESYDGSVLLSNLLEDFLIINERLFSKDNRSISEFKVVGSTAPECIKQGAESNAKPIYHTAISAVCTGVISWTTDTQGPVFRGININS